MGLFCSLILGRLKMTNNSAGSGMGTAGLVGPLGCWDTMAATIDHGFLIAEIIGLYFIAPALLSLFFHLIMKKSGLVKDGVRLYQYN